MLCIQCHEIKLSKEYALKNGSSCSHPSFWCLQCCIESISPTKPQCPECKAPLNHVDITSLQKSFQILSQTEQFNNFNIINNNSTNTINNSKIKIPSISQSDHSQFSGDVRITMLNGFNFKISFTHSTTTIDFQQEIHKTTNVLIPNQRLIYNNEELCFTKKKKYLRDYKIQNGGVIQLMATICEIQKNLKNITFDLNWGFCRMNILPGASIFLDGSCFCYNSKHELLLHVDFSNKIHRLTGLSLIHSGDQLDNRKTKGHQFIKVNLDALPLEKKISDYENPTVTLFDDNNPETPLVSTVVEYNHASQAIILCNLMRVGKDWKVFVIGKGCAGNAKNYPPIHEAIQSCLQ